MNAPKLPQRLLDRIMPDELAVPRDDVWWRARICYICGGTEIVPQEYQEYDIGRDRMACCGPGPSNRFVIAAVKAKAAAVLREASPTSNAERELIAIRAARAEWERIQREIV